MNRMRCLTALVAACVSALAIGAGQAFAGGLLPVPGTSQTSSQDQSVTNQTSQENEAVAVSPTLRNMRVK